ncbi:MAG: orotidine 5'-phosphate decarboxylase [Desulfovibrio sp.]|nr:orotidine 5'-phosphate decarboxylase [Desulfovibrio sp.]
MARLVLALDVPESHRALMLARELAGIIPWCKIGLELFTLAGPNLLGDLKALGYKIFLDLKFYDILHTVGRADSPREAALNILREMEQARLR